MTGERILERSPARVFSDWNPQASAASLNWLMGHGLPYGPARFRRDVHGILQSLETLLGAGPVIPLGDDMFRIDQAHGAWAVLQPILDHISGELIDIICWHPSRPARRRFLTGGGEILGSIWLHIGEPETRVFATPLSWVRADGAGICLLRRSRMTVLRHLTLLRVLEVDDPVLADWLDRTLRDPGPVPLILVNTDARAIAQQTVAGLLVGACASANKLRFNWYYPALLQDLAWVLQSIRKRAILRTDSVVMGDLRRDPAMSGAEKHENCANPVRVIAKRTGVSERILPPGALIQAPSLEALITVRRRQQGLVEAGR